MYDQRIISGPSKVLSGDKPGLLPMIPHIEPGDIQLALPSNYSPMLITKCIQQVAVIQYEDNCTQLARGKCY
jgi:hypothetical protein